MRKFLTIGELSKMMNISAHTIRYYEKEKLMKPSNISESGYRLYDYEDTYVLSIIMIMRDCNIPIKEIKKLMETYDKSKYKSIMNASLENLEMEIERLQKLKDHVKKSLVSVENTERDLNKLLTKKYKRRELIILKQSEYDLEYPLKEIYDLYREHSVDTTNIFREDVHYIIRDNSLGYGVYIENYKGELEKVLFEEGEYISYKFASYSNDDVSAAIIKMFSYLTQNQLMYDSELLLLTNDIERIDESFGYICDLQIKIKN